MYAASMYCKVTIINVHTLKGDYYNALESPSHEIKIVLGDFNAMIFDFLNYW